MRAREGLRWSLIPVLVVSLMASAEAIVINEIMYNPSQDDLHVHTEYIEIYNESTTPHDLGGYHFTSGITFAFPEGVRIPPGGYLLVVEDRDAFLAAYPGVDTDIVFVYEAGKLDNAGERLAIANPGGGDPSGGDDARPPHGGEVSVVNYKDGGRWPAAADGTGYSLSLIDPFLPSDEVESWAASPVMYGTPGGPNGLGRSRIETPVIPAGGQWKLFKGTQEPSSPPDDWRATDFDDGAWQTAEAGVGYGDGDDATELGDMRSKYTSAYLRRAFDLASLPEGASLILAVSYDDGFVAYLNGTEVARSDTMAGRGDPPPYDATSRSHEANGVFEEHDITAFADLLRAGGNVLAVQGHNSSRTSSDFTLHPTLLVSAPLSHAIPVIFNEMYYDDTTAWVELHNRTGSPVDLGGMYLSNDPDVLDLYRIPEGSVIPAHGFLVFDQGDISFSLVPTRNPDPDPDRPAGLRLKLYLASADGTQVLAAHRFEWLETGSAGRYPDGGERWYTIPAPTRGAANELIFDDRIVISEIMYHPITEDPDDEYVEIYNRSDEAVDLTYWAFTKGIRYAFEAGRSLGPGAYLVIAKNPGHIAQKYGISNVVGPFVGGLANDGERIRLSDPDGNPADDVLFRDGDPWPKLADGGGSSLELIDPRQDNSLMTAWGASAEAGKAAWQYFEYAKQHRSRIGRTPDSEIQLCLLTRGACLVDEIKLVRGSTDYVRNGSFESGSNYWVIQGTHVDSHVVSGDARDGSAALLVVSSGRGDQLTNRIEQQLSRSLSVGQTYTISFWAKWQGGSPWLLTRTHGHGVARANRLPVPERLGTPGGPNSIARANQGPVMDDLGQDPIRPSSSQAVRVTVRVQDADGVAAVVLRHKADGSGAFEGVAMADDGLDGDGAANDGIWGAELPARGNRTIVRFYIEATDTLGETEVFPRGAPELAAVYQVDGSADTGGLWHYRLVHINEVESELNSRPRMSNHLVPGTFLFGDREIFYNVGIRYRGSPWTRPGNPRGYRIRFPAGQPLRGFREINLDGQGQDGTHQHDRTAFWLERKVTGTAYSDVDYTRLHVDGGGGVLYDEPRKVDLDYCRFFWPAAEDGYLFKVDDYFEFYNDSSHDRAYSDAYLNYVGEDREQYRWMFKLRSREFEDDAAYEKLVALARFMDPTSTSSTIFDRDVWSVLAVDEWLGHLAVRFLLDDWDGYGYNRGKNTYFYLPPWEGARWIYIAWDRDLTFGNASAPTVSGKFRDIQRLLTRPALSRRYWGIYDELTGDGGPFTRDVIDPELDGVSAVIGINPGSIKNFVSSRTSVIRRQIPSTTLRITRPSSDPYVTPETSVEIRGRAPVSMWTIEIRNDRLGTTGTLPVSAWTSSTGFRIRVDLGEGRNPITFTGLDRSGEGIEEITITVTSTNEIPRITSVTPSRGPEAGGTRVTIAGENFKDGATVLFGAVEASDVVVAGPGEIQATSPSGTGEVNVTVRNTDATSGTFCCFAYEPFPMPRIDRVFPGGGPATGGTEIGIFGENFQPGAVVRIGGKPAAGVTFSSETELRAVTPPADPGVMLADVELENPDGHGFVFRSGFLYLGAPPVSRFVRGDASGDGGLDISDAIQILGYLFGGDATDCEDALDTNDDGRIDIADAIGVLAYLFQDGEAPAAPFPAAGQDPTTDTLDCER